MKCEHIHRSPRLRTLSNKATAVYIQCHNCGDTLSSAIKKSDLTPEQFAALEPFDDNLKDQHWQKNSAQFQIEREAEAAKRVAGRRAKYEEYLQSPAWKMKREAVMERDEYRCRGCGHARATDVHHLTYDHIFDELLFELVAICRPCHHRCHRGYE